MLVITSQLSNILRADLSRINPVHFEQLKNSIETYLLLKIEANICRITNQNNPTPMVEIRKKKIDASSNIEAVQGKQVLIKLKNYLKSFKGVLDKDNTPEALKKKLHREAIIKTIVATSFRLPLDPYQPEQVQKDVWQRLQAPQNPLVQDIAPEPEKEESPPEKETNYLKIGLSVCVVVGVVYAAYTYREVISTKVQKAWNYYFPSDKPVSNQDNKAASPANHKEIAPPKAVTPSKPNVQPSTGSGTTPDNTKKPSAPSVPSSTISSRLKDHVNAYLGMTADGIKSARKHFLKWSSDKERAVKFNYDTYRNTVIELLKSGLTLKQIHDRKIISDDVYYYIVHLHKIDGWIRNGVLPLHK